MRIALLPNIAAKLLRERVVHDEGGELVVSQ
jgi:hypothetical protein